MGLNQLVDKTFYKNAGPFTLSKISEFLIQNITGNKEKIILILHQLMMQIKMKLLFLINIKISIINQMLGLLLLKIVNSLQMKKILFF